MKAWMRSASTTAIATVSTSSISPFMLALCSPGATARPIAALHEPDPVRRPVGQKRLADDPRSWDGSPEPAVLGVGPVVAHHVVVAAGDGDRLREVARLAAVALNDVGVVLSLAVADHVAVADRETIAGQAHDALDKRL